VDVLCTVEASVRDMLRSEHPTILQDGVAPYKIVAANSAWRTLCGFPGAEAIGATTKILQGTRTDHSKARHFRDTCVASGAGRATMVNYKKCGQPFCHRIRANRVGLIRPYFLTQSTEVTDNAIQRALLPGDPAVQPLGSAVFSVVFALLLASLVLVVDGDDATTGVLSAIVIGVLSSCLQVFRGLPSIADRVTTLSATSSGVAEIVVSAGFFLPMLAAIITALADTSNGEDSTATPSARCSLHSLAGCFRAMPTLTLDDPRTGPLFDPYIERYMYGSPWMDV
jgi:hypothetical protein